MNINISVNDIQKNTSVYFDRAVTENDVISVSTEKGNAVIISESDYRDMMETIYLLSIPGLKERIIEAGNEPLEESSKFEW